MSDFPLENVGGSERLTQKWEPVLEGINDNYTRKVTASLLENQAKAIMNDRQKMISEAAVGTGTTTVGMLGTFQKFAMPIVRRVYPNLIFNQLGATQPMQGPVSQVFYLGHNRVYADDVQNVYSKFNLTYRGLVADRIGSASVPDQSQSRNGQSSRHVFQEGFGGNDLACLSACH